MSFVTYAELYKGAEGSDRKVAIGSAGQRRAGLRVHRDPRPDCTNTANGNPSTAVVACLFASAELRAASARTRSPGESF